MLKDKLFMDTCLSPKNAGERLLSRSALSCRAQELKQSKNLCAINLLCGARLYPFRNRNSWTESRNDSRGVQGNIYCIQWQGERLSDHNGLDNRDNYYMKHVYLACVRCIDLLFNFSYPNGTERMSLYKVVAKEGLCHLITAGLDSRVTACVANHPALSNMAGYMAALAGGYPHFFR